MPNLANLTLKQIFEEFLHSEIEIQQRVTQFFDGILLKRVGIPGFPVLTFLCPRCHQQTFLFSSFHLWDISDLQSLIWNKMLLCCQCVVNADDDDDDDED